MIVQMPLESDNEIDSDLVLDTISPDKDVDGWVSFFIILALSRMQFSLSVFELSIRLPLIFWGLSYFVNSAISLNVEYTHY